MKVILSHPHPMEPKYQILKDCQVNKCLKDKMKEKKNFKCFTTHSLKKSDTIQKIVNYVD
jgi:hypothetical protein